MIQIKTYFLSNRVPVRTVLAVSEKISVPINERLFNFQKSFRVLVNFYSPKRERVLIKTKFVKSPIKIKSRHLGRIRLPIKSFFYKYDIEPTSSFLQYLSELGVNVS